VRVNVLALALLHRFRRALPDVLRTRIMDPIGASRDWEWRGYRNSVVEIDGRAIESVAGGGHWGGGMFISSFDHARLALLVQRRGRWNDREVLPEAWIAQMTTPSAANPAYGFLWWLNTGRQLFPSASPGSVFALGGGQHVLWIDDTHDLLMVARWVDRRSCDGVIAKVLASIV
jgi:CubicO group peptidase (beta-lactamase class C family)